MGWTNPLTAVANTGLSAGQWNASVRDNLLETTPGKANLTMRIFVTAGVNAIAERGFEDGIVDANESTTSTSYTDLATDGPILTHETGATALVWTTGQLKNSSTTNTLMTFNITGSSSVTENDTRSLECDGGSGSWMPRCTVTNLMVNLDPGIQIFTAKYRVTGGTGNFAKRRIVVMGL